MITEQDLLQAIAECQGERNPNANTCIKLAAYYTIRNELFGTPEPLRLPESYSFSPGPEPTTETSISYTSGTDFGKAITGKDSAALWALMDDLMSTLQIAVPKLYDGVMRQLPT